MTDLSPQAQAVLNAFLDEWDVYAVDKARYGLAAALRAAANQVAPKDVPEMSNCCHELLESIHEHINEIAAELETTNG